MSSDLVAVFGPTGYTGRQVLAELRRRGLTPLLVGRDCQRLEAVAEGDEVAGRRWAQRGGQLELITGEPRYGSFGYPAPLGVEPVMEDYPLPEAVTVPRHLDAATVRLVMTASTLRAVLGPDVSSSAQVTDQDRADSRFMVVALVTDGETERRTVATGRDIYGVTAPMIVATAQALLSEPKSGVLTISQVVEPADLLVGLHETHWLEIEQGATHDLKPSPWARHRNVAA